METTRIIYKDNELKRDEQQRYLELEKLERDNRAKSELLLSMSHNMRTPLNAIMGLVSLMENDVNDAVKVMENVQKLKSSCRYLLSMINDMLDMNSIESQLFTINSSEFEPENLIDDINIVMEQLAAEKKVRYIVDKENISSDRIIGDKVHLYQVLLNILSNAVKYTPEGGEVRFVTRQSIKEKSSVIRFEISDTGIGMSKEFMERLFEPYAREMDRIPNGTMGNGLGLSIVKKLVDLMDGKIYVSSTVGRGSTFIIEMSLDIVDDIDENEANEPEVDEIAKCFKGRRFLIAEDNKINGDIIATFLQYESASSVVCMDGRDALETYMREPAGTFDMILMDTRMPLMNGYEVSMAIRNSDKEDAKTIPILSMTADAFGEDAVKAKNAGMNGHIAKPIDFEVLRAIITKNLK